MTPGRARLAIAVLLLSALAAWFGLRLIRPPADVASTARGVVARPAATPTEAPVIPPAAPARLVPASISASPPTAGDVRAGAAAETQQAAAEDLRTLELELVYESGIPASRVPCVVAQGWEVLASGFSDETGRKLSPKLNQRATLYVNAPPVFRTSLEPGSGPRRIVVPDSARVSGWVTIQGQPPGDREVSLSVLKQAAPVPGNSKIPPDVARLLAFPIIESARSTAQDYRTVSGDGAFAFGGFRDGELVRFWAKGTHGLRNFRLASGGNSTHKITAPASDLRFDLVPLPVVHGRAVWLDTGEPVPDCSVRYRLQFDRSQPAAGEPVPPGTAPLVKNGFARSDDGGHFGLYVSDEDATCLSLEVSLLDAEHEGFGHLLLDGARVAEVTTRGLELGDIALRRARTVTFRVRDETGASMPGVFATAKHTEELRSAATDADGRAEMRLPPEPVEISFWAARRETGKVMANGSGDDHLEVTLVRCASLEVTVMPPEAFLAHGRLRFVLDSPKPAFTGNPGFGPEPTRSSLDGADQQSIEVTDADPTQPLRLSGRVTYDLPIGSQLISCLRPGVPLTVSIIDDRGEPVWGPQVITLDVGEARTIEASLPTVAGK
jgi:hypothetical protein